MSEPVFRNCNVCGRELARDDELAVGACAICMNEEVPIEPEEPQKFTIEVTRKEFLTLPMSIRRKALKKQADRFSEVTCQRCGNYFAGHATGSSDICCCTFEEDVDL